MNIAILEAGTPPQELIGRFGRYPDMLRRLLDVEAASYDVSAGEWPERPAAHDAYIVTGSPAGVYDRLPWIEPLKTFLREAGEAKLVGICFGHQIMAEAFGGKVAKSDKGWGVGLHDYAVTASEPWMDGSKSVAIPASHQDQVIVSPPASRIIAASDFTPIAGLAYDDRPAISFQFHPEFEPDFAKALIDIRRDRLPDPDSAIASLDRPNDRERVGEWIRRYLAA